MKFPNTSTLVGISPPTGNTNISLEGILSPQEIVQSEDFSWINGAPSFRRNISEIEFCGKEHPSGLRAMINYILEFSRNSISTNPFRDQQYSVDIFETANSHIEVAIFYEAHSNTSATENMKILVSRLLLSRWGVLSTTLNDTGCISDISLGLCSDIVDTFYEASAEDPGEGVVVNNKFFFMPKPRGSDEIAASSIYYRGTKKISTEFYPELDLNMMFDDFMLSKESILFIKGIPGVGKTCMINALFNRAIEMTAHHNRTGDTSELIEAYRNITSSQNYYVKDASILCRDSFWADLLSEKPPLLILDDFTKGLGPRCKYEDDSFVERLLSASDGVFENLTKVLITTNNGKSDIDPALMRPGRCFDYIELKKLSKEYADVLWAKLAIAAEAPGLAEAGYPLEIPKDGLTAAEFSQVFDQYVKNGTRKRYQK